MDGPGLGAGTSLGRAGAGWGWGELAGAGAGSVVAAGPRQAQGAETDVSATPAAGGRGSAGCWARQAPVVGASFLPEPLRVPIVAGKGFKGMKKAKLREPGAGSGVGEDMVRGKAPHSPPLEVKLPIARIGEQVTLMV